MIKPQDLTDSALIIILLSYIFLFIEVLAVIIHEYHEECIKKRDWF